MAFKNGISSNLTMKTYLRFIIRHDKCVMNPYAWNHGKSDSKQSFGVKTFGINALKFFLY